MKTNFSARPVFHQKRERIIAHFMICYTALLIYRLMEKKLDLYGTHFTVDSIIKTLNSMNVVNIEDMCYMSAYTSSEICTSLNAVTGLGLDKKYYQPKELNKKNQKNFIIFTISPQKLSNFDYNKAKYSMMIKCLLKRHRYPPEGMDDAVQTVMTQCELWTDNNDMESA